MNAIKVTDKGGKKHFNMLNQAKDHLSVKKVFTLIL